MRAEGLGHRWSRFLRAEAGAVTVEMLFSVVVMNMLLMAFFFWWGAYSSHALVDRMAYTVNDLVTRQRGTTLDRSFLDGLERTAEFILDEDQDAAIRFTQVTMRPGETEGDPPYLAVEWSYSPCGAMPVAVIEAGFDEEALPMMAVGATMVVTDVRVPYISTLDLLPSLDFERRAVSLYRFEPRFDLQGDGTTACID